MKKIIFFSDIVKFGYGLLGRLYGLFFCLPSNFIYYFVIFSRTYGIIRIKVVKKLPPCIQLIN